MEYIACPGCGKKVEATAILCPHCTTRVQYVLQQRREKERQVRIQRDLSESNRLKEEYARHEELLREEQNKRCPVDSMAPYHSLTPVFLGAFLAILSIPILKWFSLLAFPFFPIFCIMIHEKMVKSELETWVTEHNRIIREHKDKMQEIETTLKRYGISVH